MKESHDLSDKIHLCTGYLASLGFFNEIEQARFGSHEKHNLPSISGQGVSEQGQPNGQKFSKIFSRFKEPKTNSVKLMQATK